MKPKNQPGNKESAFTLLELVTVIFIMGVFLAVGIPNLLQYQSRARLRGAARQVMVDLTAARMEAIKGNSNVIVDFENPDQYVMVVDSNGNNTHDDPETKVIKDVSTNFPGVKNIKEDTKNIFNAKGAMKRMRNIILANESGQVTIRVSISGRIRIE